MAYLILVSASFLRRTFVRDNGFVIFRKEENYDNGAECIDYAFIKLVNDFFINNITYTRRSSKVGIASNTNCPSR